MKRILLFVLLFAGAMALGNVSDAVELKVSTVNEIPERYVLVQLHGADPDETLDKDVILSQMKGIFEKTNVKQLQFAIYDQGKNPGDGVHALGEISKNAGDIVDFLEIPREQRDTKGKFTEKMFGYQATPKELYEAYSDNEVVADDDFKGKIVILQITVPQVSKDALDKPYIHIPLDGIDISGLRVYLQKSDPLLRKIRKGSKIVVRGMPQGFVVQNVMVDGEIVTATTGKEVFWSVDGKAELMPEK